MEIHLGLLCDEYMSSSGLVREGIKKLRETPGSILSSGFTHREINPLTLSKIYCSLVLPKAFYRAQKWSNCLKADVEGLQIPHRKCLKQIATRSFYTDTTFTLTPLDMESAEDIVDCYNL